MSDLRYAARLLARSPGFASVAILSLALGIGANAAIYAVIRSVLLDPLPVRAPEELVALGWTADSATTSGILSINSTSYRDERTGRSYRSNFSYTLYRAFRAIDRDLFAFSYAASDVSVSFGGGQPVVGSGLLVSGNYFSVLGVSTVLGRPLIENDDRVEAPPVTVLAYAFWQRMFGGDPGVLQRTIFVDGAPFTIVGVAAQGFYGMSKGGQFFKPSDLLMPLAVQPLVYTRGTPRSLLDADDRLWLQMMTRRHAGTPTSQLEAGLNGAFRSTLAASPVSALREISGGEVRLVRAPRGLDSWTRGLRQPLVILGVVVGVVLLIACVNIGNLMLVRNAARQKELSIRLALGSSRWRLVRAMLAESVILSVAGGTLGVLVGVLGARALVSMIIATSTRTALDITIDAPLVGAAAASSVIAALLFSAVPAVRLARGRLASALRQGGTGGTGVGLRAGRVLMAAQVAISVPLLVGAGLFLRTVYNLGAVDLGFDPKRLLIFHVDPSLNGYDATHVETLYGRLLERVGAVPGVDSATITDIVLMSQVQDNWTFIVPGSGPKTVKFARVGPAYFDTFGIPVLTGRTIGVQDGSGAPRVAVMNKSAAHTLFGSDRAIGQRLTMQSDPPIDFEIVGIVENSRYTSPRDPMPPTIYLPYLQTTLGRLGPMNVVVRSATSAATVSRLITAAIAEVDPNLPATDFRTQMTQIDDSLGTERTFRRLLLVFGAFALLLSSIGLHGLTAYSVVRRTSEIGVRVAFGASRRHVLWLILRQVVGLTVVGLAIGIPTAIALTRFVRASLYGVEPADPLSVAGAIIVMTSVALIAGYFPARRAVGLDPLVALRDE